MLCCRGSFQSARFITKFVLILLVGSATATTPLIGYYVSLGGSLRELPPSPRWTWNTPASEEPSSPPTIEVPDSDFKLHGTWPGIRLPPVLSRKAARVPAGTEVIGVCVEGKARAYTIFALVGGPAYHVVNDMIDGHPVSVIYCDRMRCTRAFSSEARHEPLPLDCGGWEKGKGMILQIDGVDYALEDGTNLSDPEGSSLPYQPLKCERTTWGDWCQAHPNSDIYLAPPDRPWPFPRDPA